jgi:hypothetical protein
MLHPAVWELLFEWCAGLFGETVRSRLGQLVLFCLGIFVLGLVFSMEWGLYGWLPPVVLVALAVAAARQVAVARSGVWRAACLELDETGQRPDEAVSRVLAPTAASLQRLAIAVDLVRRSEYVAARDLVAGIHRDLLRPEELQLVDAVEAMVAVGLGSTDRAARRAVAALPTGSEALDVCLGRTVLMEAWNDPARLTAILAAWERAGVRHGPMQRLTGLLRLRVDASALERLEPPEARDLSDEARAVGDDELAAELDARGRTAYR